MINLSFDPDVYLTKLIDKLAKERQHTGLAEKAVRHIKKGIYVEFLGPYLNVSAVEDLIALDARVANEVNTLIPFLAPLYREPAHLSLPKPWATSTPTILPQPLIISESKDPLKVTYGDPSMYTTN